MSVKFEIVWYFRYVTELKGFELKKRSRITRRTS